MALRGTDPDSYITEYTLVYEKQHRVPCLHSRLPPPLLGRACPTGGGHSCLKTLIICKPTMALQIHIRRRE